VDKIPAARERREALRRIADDLREVAGNSTSDTSAIELREVEAALEALDRVIHTDRPDRSISDPHDSRVRRRPVRALVLDALEDLRWPAYTREIAHYCQARYGRELSPTRFGTLASDEIRSYVKGKRPQTVWLCFGLTSTRGEAIRRLWARSDWPLEQRIVAPTTGRIQHLRMTLRLCEIALEASATAADPEMLRIIAADHARDLPGVTFRRGEFRLEEWGDLATVLLEKAGPADGHARHEAEFRLRQLPELRQLFGDVEPIDGLGRAQRRRGTPR
jgi:hypothetical protein